MRAAWKPALHMLLEEGQGARELLWPAAAGAHPDRFLRELHPAAELRPGLRLGRAPGAVHLLDGREVWAPVRPRPLPGGGEALAACGWRRVRGPDGAVLEDGPWETPLEAALAALWEVLRAQGWRGHGPHFGTLTVRIEAALEEVPLGVGEEVLSLGEALHEEVYFGALELLGAEAGLPAGDRSLTPGRIVPEIVGSGGGGRATERGGAGVPSAARSGEGRGGSLPATPGGRPLRRARRPGASADRAGCGRRRGPARRPGRGAVGGGTRRFPAGDPRRQAASAGAGGPVQVRRERRLGGAPEGHAVPGRPGRRPSPAVVRPQKLHGVTWHGASARRRGRGAAPDDGGRRVSLEWDVAGAIPMRAARGVSSCAGDFGRAGRGAAFLG